MLTARDWRNRAKRVIRAELARHGVTYRELAERLRAIGVDDGANERNISNKISRGMFTTVFFLQVMDAIGSRTIQLDDG